MIDYGISLIVLLIIVLSILMIGFALIYSFIKTLIKRKKGVSVDFIMEFPLRGLWRSLVLMSCAVLVFVSISLTVYPEIRNPSGYNSWMSKIESIDGVKIIDEKLYFEGPFFDFGIITLDYKSNYRVELFHEGCSCKSYPFEEIRCFSFGGKVDARIPIDKVNNLLTANIASFPEALNNLEKILSKMDKIEEKEIIGGESSCSEGVFSLWSVSKL